VNLMHTNSPPIRVLIADDSAVMRVALSRVVESAPALQVCGTARNGLEVLKQIMKEFPRPVIMVSSLTQEGAEVTLEALSVGAFDYLPKSDSGCPLDPQKTKRDLIEKIEAAAKSPLARLHAGTLLPPLLARGTSPLDDFQIIPEVIALGTSTGGPLALQEVLPQLPADLPVGMIVVQHMPPGVTASFARRLNSLSKVQVR